MNPHLLVLSQVEFNTNGYNERVSVREDLKVPTSPKNKVISFSFHTRQKVSANFWYNLLYC